MIPNKLKIGDEIRIIAPSRSMGIISEETKQEANKNLEKMGFKISFGKNIEKIDSFASSSIEERLSDLHDAFEDKNVKGIITVIGGFNSNQLLKYINYDLIKNNPKVLCGYSDITALSNAIYAKTGLVTYSGPHYSSLGMKKGLEYTIDYFKKALMENKPFEILPSKEWRDDRWWENQNEVKIEKNNGSFVINEGEAEGTIIGDNLCTFNLLQGTEFMPSLKNSILFIEDDYESNDVTFDRDLQSLIHQPDFDQVRGIVIGRFQKASKITKEQLIKIIKTKKELNNIPIIAGIDNGHTTPKITIPIGGKARIIAKGSIIKIEILEH